MLIPIGQENNQVRRYPWISYTIIALNLLVFFVYLSYDARWTREFDEKTYELFDYIDKHPYLEIPPPLAQFFGDEDKEQLAQARLIHIESTGIPEPPQVELEQKKLNQLVAAWDELRQENFSFRHGFVPAEPSLVKLFTSIFVHAGWLHLLGNMLFFFVTGPFLEDLYGRPLFAGFYLLAGVVATGAHALQFPESTIPLVGASGAIAGVMGAFLIRMGGARIRLLFLPFPFIPTLRFDFHIRAFIFLPLWLGEQILAAVQEPQGSGVAWWAHVGGFLFGMAIAVALKVTRVEERYIDPAIREEISFERHPSFAKAVEARTEGRLEHARTHIEKAIAAEPNDVDAWAESYTIARARNDEKESGRIAVRLVNLYVKSGDLDLAREFTDDVIDGLGDALPPKFYLEVAGLCERERSFRSAQEHYQTVADRFPTDPASYTALWRMGQFFRRAGNLEAARETFTRARAHPVCIDPEMVDRALAEIEKKLSQSGPGDQA